MEKIKFNIAVPQKGEGWKIDTRNGHSKRTSSKLVMKLLERKLMKLSASPAKIKTSIKVKYRRGYHNESVNYLLTPQSVREILWVTSCFLEDYLHKGSLKRFEKFRGSI